MGSKINLTATAQSQNEYLVSQILKWAKLNLRTFPWRINTNPWNVLVAEILLRRTTSKQVISIFDELMELIPDPKSAANIDIDVASKLLQPLGLTKRTFIIKEIGGLLSQKHNNKVPSDLDALLSLPHVGNYTARSVRCFSYKQKELVLDVNIVRVISRFLLFPITPRLLNKPYENKDFVSLMREITPESESDIFYWALLDLGGTICMANKCLCQECCLNELCNNTK